MQTGLRAIGWSLQRLAVVVGVTVMVAFSIYALWVTAIIVGQAFGG